MGMPCADNGPGGEQRFGCSAGAPDSCRRKKRPHGTNRSPSLQKLAEFPGFHDKSVQIWTTRLDAADCELEFAAMTLSGAERERAEAFLDAGERRRFIITRWSVRILLGEFLREPPERIQLRVNEFGRPELARDAGLDFNVSHSESVALIGLAAQGRVGVDIERVSELRDPLRLAEIALSTNERAALERLPEAERDDAFYRAWTRKEAYAKARGTGIFTGFQEFDVSLDVDPRVPAPATRYLKGDRYAWSMHHLQLPGYVGAAICAVGFGRSRRQHARSI